MVSLTLPVLGPADLGASPRNRCLLIGKIQCPESYIGSSVMDSPFVDQCLQELGAAIGEYFGRSDRFPTQAVFAMGDPFVLSKGQCGRFLLIATRICVSDLIADTLDQLAGPSPGLGGSPGKPAGVLPLRWGSSGTQVELQWETREAPSTYRASGFPYWVTAENLLRALRNADLQVSEVASPISPIVSIPMHGVFDITFEAGAKAPSQLEFPDIDGQIRKCQLRRITQAPPSVAGPAGTTPSPTHRGRPLTPLLPLPPEAGGPLLSSLAPVTKRDPRSQAPRPKSSRR
jgi:hypothetical protein